MSTHIPPTSLPNGQFHYFLHKTAYTFTIHQSQGSLSKVRLRQREMPTLNSTRSLNFYFVYIFDFNFVYKIISIPSKLEQPNQSHFTSFRSLNSTNTYIAHSHNVLTWRRYNNFASTSQSTTGTYQVNYIQTQTGDLRCPYHHLPRSPLTQNVSHPSYILVRDTQSEL